jgi:hypothetical protein
MRPDLDAIDPTFKADIKESERAVWLVARWLHSLGKHVTVRALEVRPTVEEIEDYGDHGDLEVILRYEVKRRSLAFTGAADFPFPSVIVDSVRKWDKAHPKPHLYVIVNTAGTVAAIVEGGTAPKWETETLPIRNRPIPVYVCPIAYVKFCAIPPEVRTW